MDIHSHNVDKVTRSPQSIPVADAIEARGQLGLHLLTHRLDYTSLPSVPKARMGLKLVLQRY